METTSKIPWLRILGWAVLIHIILIAISVAEVFIYSQFNPGHHNEFYKAHAEVSGPYISMIFGFILFFLIVRMLSKSRWDKRFLIAILLPVIYTILDFVILQASGVNWHEHLMVFIISFLIKAAGSSLGAFTVKQEKIASGSL